MTPPLYDIVVYGASGFTGRLCLRYLLNCSSSGKTSFAAAGRSEDKIKSVLKDLGAPNVPILIADSDDDAALEKMVKQAKCVITLAGPYHLYGSKLIKACAENGVHCCDLTGEATWSYEMIEQHEAAAKRTKAIFIHGAGFDSIPGDIGTYLAVKKLQSATSSPCGLVTTGYKAKGGFSGGTFSTFLVVSGLAAKDKKYRRILANPYSLSPVKGTQRLKPFFSLQDGKTVGAYYMMEPANLPVIQQSWGLLEQEAKKKPGSFSYGPEFQYREHLVMPNRVVATVLSSIIYFMGALFYSSSFIRSLAKKYGLQSGDGPSEDAMQNGWMDVRTTARSVDGKSFARARFVSRGDPGYAATSYMICETALGLVHDYDQLSDLAKEGGHLTAATVFGDKVLRERLIDSGKFDISVELVDSL